MESKTYKELQALAKLHGVKANGTRNALIGKLRDKLGENSSVDDNEDHKPRDSIDPEMPTINTMDASAPPGPEEPEVATERRKSGRLLATKEIIDIVPTMDAPTPASRAVPAAVSERCKSERLSATKETIDFAAPAGPAEPVATTERRTSERLSATKTTAPLSVDAPARSGTQDQDHPGEPEGTGTGVKSNSEHQSATKKKKGPLNASRKTKTMTKTKVKQPTAGPSRRFERMHQNLFAGQASIEKYSGKTPKKTAPAKENVPLPKATPLPVRPVAFGSPPGVKSAKRGLTVASKPCTLVVQRSNKKPTQVKEFRLSSNQNGKREGFKFRPYSGPVRPMTPANTGTGSFKVGVSSASAQRSRKNSQHLRPVGVKATLASGKAQSARKEAHVQAGQIHREKIIKEARVGRS